MAITKWKRNENYDPWEEFKVLQNEINDLFNIDRYPSSTGLFDRSASPAVDIVEGDHDFTIRCELPGMEKDDVEVSIASNVLTIKGSKKDDRTNNEGKYFRRETWSGSFQRTLPLPSTVEVEKIGAELRDGILRLVLPKKEEAKPKQIAVKVK